MSFTAHRFSANAINGSSSFPVGGTPNGCSPKKNTRGEGDNKSPKNNGLETAMGGITQIIGSDADFMPSVAKWLESDGFNALGFEYSVATVLGCQSSGKSTLLNYLFGTKFPVMNAKLGRQQTTKGAWLSTSRLLSIPVAIIDVEGTDSRERGEDRMTFEHRAALFSLALADVVIVNMWYHDLGRYTASNYGLLKTVLAVNLGLFQQQKDCPKTVLLFVIRDYIESQTPIDTLHRMIYDDVASIWKEIKKPDHLSTSTADDFFEFRLVGLASGLTDTQGFFAGIDKLRHRWEQDFLPGTYSRKIPADGFAYYLQSVWETILDQSELDIPSQKEMLASYRCEEIKNSVLAQFAFPIQEKLASAQLGQLLDFTSWAKDLLMLSIETYNIPASRYQEGVFLRKREQLIDCLCAELQKVVDAHLIHVRRRIYEEESCALEKCFPQEDDDDLAVESVRLEMWRNFHSTCDSWRSLALNRFDAVAKKLNSDSLAAVCGTSTTSPLLLPSPDPGTGLTCETLCSSSSGGGGSRSHSAHNPAASVSRLGGPIVRRFQTTHVREALAENLDSAIGREKERQLREFGEVMAKTAAAHFSDLDDLLSDPDVDAEIFWSEVKSFTTEAKQLLKEEYILCWRGFQTSSSPAYEAALSDMTSGGGGGDDNSDGNTRRMIECYGEAEEVDNAGVVDDEHWDIRCAREALQQARVKLEYLAEWMHIYIINRFKALFNSDKQGVPRQWPLIGPKKIKSIFIDARSAALGAVDILQSMLLTESQFLPEDVKMDRRWRTALLTEHKKASIIQRSTKTMQRSCQEAQILQAASGRQTHIPLWFYLLLVALGWNEFYAIVSSPLILIAVVLIGIIGGVTYVTGQTTLLLRAGKQSLAAGATLLMPILLMFQENALPLGSSSNSPEPPRSPTKRLNTSSSLTHSYCDDISPNKHKK